MSKDNRLLDTFLLVLGGLVGLALIVLVFVQYLSTDSGQAGSQDPAAVAQLEDRIRPVGQVAVAGEENIPAPATADEAVVDAPGVAAADEGAAVEESAVDEPIAAAGVNGEEIYNQACVLCHGAGIAGAPKVGDTANWEPRIAQGMDTVYANAINGFQGSAGMMPPKGGRMDLADDAIRASVDYMVENSQ